MNGRAIIPFLLLRGTVLVLCAVAVGMLLEEDVTRSIAPREPWVFDAAGWHIEVGREAPRVPAPPEGVASSASQKSEPLSPYDDLIRRIARQEGVDWRLIAAIVFEESGAKPDSESAAGAVGLMQVRPVAAREVGEVDFHDPEANVRTGVRYFQRLERSFVSAPQPDRVALTLAAYNVGPGHVRDAQVLARRFGYDPLRWKGSMDGMLALLSQPVMYRQTKHGFAQGAQAVAYVNRVLARFDHYRVLYPDLLVDVVRPLREVLSR